MWLADRNLCFAIKHDQCGRANVCIVSDAGPRLFTAFRTSTSLLPDLESRTHLQSRILRNLSVALTGEHAQAGLICSVWRLSNIAQLVLARIAKAFIVSGYAVPCNLRGPTKPGGIPGAVLMCLPLSLR